MLFLPQFGRHRYITNAGIVGTVSLGTALPGNATTLLDGAVTECISAANNTMDSWGIDIFLGGTGVAATSSEACADILVGGATDDVLIAALICGFSYQATGDNNLGVHYLFPVHIPAGKRVAATLASVRTSITARIVVTLMGGGTPPWRVGRKVETIGTQINNARGQSITMAASGATASVTELVASSANPYFAWQLGLQTNGTTTTGKVYNMGIGIGAATEDRIGTPWWFCGDTGEQFSQAGPYFPIFHDVPAATRISVLAGNSGTNDTGGYDGLIYGVV